MGAGGLIIGGLVDGQVLPSAPQALAYSATLTPPEATLDQIYSVTLTGNATLQPPANLRVGGGFWLFVYQDETGSRTMAYDEDYVFTEGTAPDLTTTANALDVFFVWVISASTLWVANVSLNVS